MIPGKQHMISKQFRAANPTKTIYISRKTISTKAFMGKMKQQR
jgi:hypothetical protein